MNREIRFRAWDKANRRMSEPFTFGDLYGYEGEVNAVILSHPYREKGQDITICSHDRGSLAYPQFPTENGINPDIELMQFTGLKDKHGKEIFEGDILKADWHDGRYPVHTIGPVKWDEENARWDLGEGGSSKVDAQYHFEVIGNIYETPDLMKETP